MKQLDWYNECDVYVLARIEAGRFLSCDSGDLEKKHFKILENHYFNLWMNDFEEFKQAAWGLGYQAVREDEQD